MRKLTFKERQKNGCEYCRDAVFRKPKTPSCTHEECPYQELNGHKTYIDYLEANDMNFYNIMNKRGNAE